MKKSLEQKRIRVNRGWCRCRYSKVMAILLGLGVQCFAHAGFAVNQDTQSEEVLAANAENLVPQFVTKDQALDIEQKETVTVVIADVPGYESYVSLNDVPDQGMAVFYYNPYSHKIAIAPTKKEAIALAQINREIFFAQKGESLSATVERWVSFAHDSTCPQYTAYWDSPFDYTIQFSGSFFGDLLTPSGALNQLLKSFEQSDYGLQAEVTQNCVIKIEPLSFKQQTVIGV